MVQDHAYQYALKDEMLCKEPVILKFLQAYKAATWVFFQAEIEKFVSYLGQMIFWIVYSKLESQVESICSL